MPYKEIASWEGPPHFRWVKMVKGVRHRVKCADLGLNRDEWTKEGSRDAANRYFSALIANQNLGVIAREPEVEKALADLDRKLTFAASHDTGLLPPLERTKAAIDAASEPTDLPRDDDDVVAENIRIAEMLGIKVAPDADPLALQQFFGNARLWQDRLKRQAKVESNFLLSHQAEQFLSVERVRTTKVRTFGDLSENIRGVIIKMKPLHPALDVRTIDETTVKDFFISLGGSGRGSRKKLWGFFKRLVRFVASSRLMPMPMNLMDRTFRFNAPPKKVKEHSLEEVKECLATLPPRMKLYALMSLNCGMQGVDMASLKPAQWVKGRIKRKRTKTEGESNVPEVDYLLWGETEAALKRWAVKGETVLVSKTGTPLVEYTIDAAGKETAKDLIRQQWKRAEPKPTLPLKTFRTFGAQVIRNAVKYGGKIEYTVFYHHYLGHSPKGIGETNYAPPSRELFDEIITWLARFAHRVFCASAVAETGAVLEEVGRHMANFGRRNFFEGILAPFSCRFLRTFSAGDYHTIQQ